MSFAEDVLARLTLSAPPEAYARRITVWQRWLDKVRSLGDRSTESYEHAVSCCAGYFRGRYWDGIQWAQGPKVPTSSGDE